VFVSMKSGAVANISILSRHHYCSKWMLILVGHHVDGLVAGEAVESLQQLSADARRRLIVVAGLTAGALE